MMFNRRQIDELEDFSDFDDDKLETSLDDLDSMEGPTQSQFSWRRPLLLKAISNVRKLQESKLDVNQAYTKGELIFDDKANKFGRVEESKKGFLSLSLVSGGKTVIKQEEVIDLKPKSLPKKAVALKPINNRPAPALKPLVAKAVGKTKPSKVNILQSKKVLPKGKNAFPIKKKANIKVNAIESFAKFLPKGATTDPIRDPNGYIQQNFMLLNNKELAKATGLSEHTIRRKLGEWGLKRKE